MIINFDSFEEKIHTQFKGGNGDYRVRTFEDANNRIMRGLLHPGASLGMHRHEQNSEIYYILSGPATVLIDDGEEHLKAGEMHYCPMGHAHSLINSGNQDLVFLGIVAEHHD